MDKIEVMKEKIEDIKQHRKNTVKEYHDRLWILFNVGLPSSYYPISIPTKSRDPSAPSFLIEKKSLFGNTYRIKYLEKHGRIWKRFKSVWLGEIDKKNIYVSTHGGNDWYPVGYGTVCPVVCSRLEDQGGDLFTTSLLLLETLFSLKQTMEYRYTQLFQVELKKQTTETKP